MPQHDGLPCGLVDRSGNPCRCRHLWGACDCPVCQSKREQMIEKGDDMLVDIQLEHLAAPDEPDQGTLDDYGRAES